ncbi:MAG: hypothetical protein QOH33_316, partial [Paraburkholderia sp.]|nr:hypothetical protein [Paraburkholderia sp.]
MGLKDFFNGKRGGGNGSGESPAAKADSGATAPAADASGAAASCTAANGVASAPVGNGSRDAAPPQGSPLSGFTQQAKDAPPGGATDALNSQIVQAVQMSNSETAAYAASQIAVAPNMMITQAGGLVAQAAANYFDGASKLALASKSVLLKDMTEKLVKEDIKGAAEDALGVLVTDLLVGTAAAKAAAAGAIEGEATHFALDKIDQSIEKYKS